MRLDAAVESILFYKGEPVPYDTLAEILACNAEELADAIVQLEERLEDSGVRLVRDKRTVELATAPEASDLIRTLTQRELTKKLGKAGLETLTIALYQGPVSRRHIDYIRGVNSAQVLRHLLIRGLIRKRDAADGSGLTLYEPTTDLLKHLGIGSTEELPEYQSVRDEIDAFYQQSSS